MLSIKVPISQAEELIEWVAVVRRINVDEINYWLERGSTLGLPSGAVLIRRTREGGERCLKYFISGYACDGSDVKVYEPLTSYDTDVMDFMYQHARSRSFW